MVCTADGISIAFPAPAPDNRGRVYIVKNALPSSPPGRGVQVVLAGSPPTPIETLGGGQSATFVSDGVSAWQLVAAI